MLLAAIGPPRRPGPARGRGAAVAVLVAAVLGLSGCGSGETYNPALPARASSGTVQAPAGTATDGAEAAILGGYRAYWDALVTVGRAPDPASPLLAAHATGLALDQARSHLAELQRLGYADRGSVALHPTVAGVQGTTAMVEDCPDTSQWLRRDARTGALRDQTSGGRRTHLAVLFLIDDTWKVANITWKQRCGS